MNLCTGSLETDSVDSSPSRLTAEMNMHAICAVVITHYECHKLQAFSRISKYECHKLQAFSIISN